MRNGFTPEETQAILDQHYPWATKGDQVDRSWKWFKHGLQYNVRCSALTASGVAARPCITVFVEDASDVRLAAIEELKKYGYTNLHVDKIVKVT